MYAAQQDCCCAFESLNIDGTSWTIRLRLGMGLPSAALFPLDSHNAVFSMVLLPVYAGTFLQEGVLISGGRHPKYAPHPQCTSPVYLGTGSPVILVLHKM